MDYDAFKNPPAGYGEVPFFWWQGDPVTREKLLWILDQLQGRHISGLQINYAHGDSGGRIYGLTMKSQPHPLTPEWWELVKWFEGEASKRGMAISLSDYTLSTPGQQSYTDELLSEHPEFIGQILVRSGEAEPIHPEYYDIRPLCDTPDGEICAARVPYSMNPMQPGIGEAVSDKFFGAFERHMPGECGTGVNFFFSDELDFRVRDRSPAPGRLWSDEFADEFMRRKGYDIVSRLGDLFDEASDANVKTRLDYNDVVVELSEAGYFKPLYDWHQSRGMTFGCDHGGRGRDVTEFGDYFRTMKWNQGPGNDQPRLSSDIIKTKVNSSIAHLYERPRTWLEGFYSSGWQTSSADVADAIFRNFALGQNLLSLHGLYYSTHGSMWEWAPPCNHYHMPYWAEMETLLGGVERLSWLLTRGKHRCDMAIVYPVAAMEADPVRGARSVKCAFDTGEYLYAHGVDFDFIDFESVMRAETCAHELCVAGERYKTVVVPDMRVVRFGMIKRLAEFARDGGHVVILGECPRVSERDDDGQLSAYVRDITSVQAPLADAAALLDALKARFTPDIVLPESSRIPYFQHRVIDGEDMYMVYRIDDGAMCGFRAHGRPLLLDPFSGRRYALHTARVDGETTHINADTRFAGLMLVLFDKTGVEAEPLYTGAYTDIAFNGEWQCELAPTLNNRFGDYRLPSFDGYLGAEAREFDYRRGNNEPYQRSTYSYGTYFHLYEGAADETALVALDAPCEGFRPYRFSMRHGVEGDAGYQASYHGLKGRVSDDFIALGTKRLTYAGSSSEYEGDGPYYLLTRLRVDADTRVYFDTGAHAPDASWLDHKLITVEPRPLTAGLHTLLLKYAHGLRTRFAVLRADAPEFAQQTPLATRWFDNPNVIPFDALPDNDGSVCEFRFTAPPGTRAVLLPRDTDAEISVNGAPLAHDERTCDGACRFTLPEPLKRSSEMVMLLREHDGIHDTALLNAPVRFECGEGVMDVGRPIEEQGLKFYSGGVRYSRGFELPDKPGHVRLVLDGIDCAASIRVNGKPTGTLFAPPYRLDISDFVRCGLNDIEVLVHNTLRNHMRTIPTNFLFEKSPRG